jgi:hypothetical protein
MERRHHFGSDDEEKSAMNIGLVVNSRGRMCMVHDQPFEHTPLWVGYHIDRWQVEIIYESGGSFLIDWEATEEMHHYLLKINKILIIRMEDKKPVEGYDTSFLLLYQGRTVERHLDRRSTPESGEVQIKFQIDSERL